MKNQNKSFWYDVAVAAILVAGIFIVAVLLNSCTSSKTVTKSTSTSNEEVKIDSTEHYKELLINERLRYEYEKSDLITRLGFEQHNTDALLYEFGEMQKLYFDKDLTMDSLNRRLRKIFDSVRNTPCKSTLKVDNKGNFEATGVKNFNLDLAVLKITTELYKDSLSKERSLRLQVEKALAQTSQTKTTVKKSGRFWWGFAFGFISCLAIVTGLLYWAVKRAEKQDVNH